MQKNSIFIQCTTTLFTKATLKQEAQRTLRVTYFNHFNTEIQLKILMLKRLSKLPNFVLHGNVPVYMLNKIDFAPPPWPNCKTKEHIIHNFIFEQERCKW